VLALIIGATIVGLAPGAHSADATGTYIVLYKGNSVPADAASVIQKAGGTLLYSYSDIGVAIARTDNSGFRANLVTDNRVDGAAATAGFATKIGDVQANQNDGQGPPPGDLPNS